MIFQRIFFNFSKQLLLLIVLCYKHRNFIPQMIIFLINMRLNVVCRYIFDLDMFLLLNLMRLFRFLFSFLGRIVLILTH